MPVDTRHPQYSALAPLWKKARDTVGGEERVKAAGTEYLPALTEQTGPEYDAYKKRAVFFTATGRTVDGLSGAINRKEPAIEGWPESRKDELESIGRSAESLKQLIDSSVREDLAMGRLGVLVDAPEEEVEGRPVPYVSMYYAEDIVNWREEVVEGRRVLTMVVLQEELDEVDPEDPFEHVAVRQYRVLMLGRRAAFDERGSTMDPRFTERDIQDPFYFQEIWQEDPNATDPRNKLVMLGRIVPRLSGGRLLREIPFVFAGPSNTEPSPEEPPLEDLMNVNLSHYRTSADLEHGRHMVALPTPWFSGFEMEGTVKIGSGVGYATKTPGANAQMLEFTGQGLGHLASALVEKERQMAVLGSRLLESQKPGVEAAETVKLRTSGEQSALSLISDTLSEVWTKALRWVWLWTEVAESADQITVQLNKEFNLLGLDAQALQALMAMLQAQAISWDTWIHNLRRSEVLPEGVDAEEESKRIAQGMPASMGPVFNEGQPKDEEEEEPEEEQPPETGAAA